MNSYSIKVNNENFGVILNETFVNASQFKLFLKLVQGCIAMKEDLTFFNGVDFLVHIPYQHLKNSVITTNTDFYTLTEHLINKSKIEMEVTK